MPSVGACDKAVERHLEEDAIHGSTGHACPVRAIVPTTLAASVNSGFNPGPGHVGETSAVVGYDDTTVLNPPYATRLTSKGMSGGPPPILAISFMTLAFTRSRCLRDLNTM